MRFILIMVLLLPPVSALTVFDPGEHENREFSEFTYEELDIYMTTNVRFVRRNNIHAICAEMLKVYGEQSAACAPRPTYTPDEPQKTYVSSALVSFRIYRPILSVW